MIALCNYDTCRSDGLLSALAGVGVSATLVRGIDDLERAHKIILPDFDSLPEAIRSFRDRGFLPAIFRAADEGRWILAIGGGGHLLLDVIHAEATHTGLGLIHGKVTRLDAANHPAGRSHAPPHRGWNRVSWRSDHGLAAGLHMDEEFYFDHAMCAEPLDVRETAAWSNYGVDFCACWSRGRLVGTQFRPEESGQAGRRVLANFISWN